MKQILFYLFLSCSLGGYSHSQERELFAKKTIDVGDVSCKQTTVVANFDFCNNTAASLVIQKVRTSCGCTSIDYPKEPLQAKEKGKIKVVLNTKGINGYFQKSIMILFSGLSPVLLKVKGNVRNN